MNMMGKPGIPEAPAEAGKGAEGTAKEKKKVELGDKFIVDGVMYEFAGVNDKKQPVGKIAGEDLHKEFNKDQIDRGTFLFEAQELLNDIKVELPKEAQEFWAEECVNNATNNPENVGEPQW